MMLSERYRQALDFAFDLHREQQRKGSGVPYMAHLLGVSSLVLEFGGDEDLAIAGLLHDAVEDQGGLVTAEQIRARFGEKVAGVVLECTDSPSEPRPPWHERKQAYLAKLPKVSEGAALVVACDKLYNLRTIVSDLQSTGDLVWDRFSGGKAGVIWYYGELGKHKRAPPVLARQFAAHLEELQTFQETAG